MIIDIPFGEIAAIVLTGEGHDSKIYNLTGPKAISNAMVAQVLTEVTGKTVNCIEISSEQLRQALLGFGVPEIEASATAELLGVMATGTAAYTTVDAERLLGRSPYDFKTFAKDFREAFGSNASAITLDSAAGYLTTINTYTVASERADKVLDYLERSAREVVRYMPGFVSMNFHMSLDRTHIVNYSQWASREAMAAAREDPKIVELMKETATVAPSSSPVLYELRKSVLAAGS